MIAALCLNAVTVRARCEDAAKDASYREQFDAVTARALAHMSVLCEWLLPFVKVGGRMLALKGPAAEEECAQAEYAIKTLGGKLVSIENAEVPGRDWEHKIVIVEKISPTPERFPRKAGIAEKRSLKNVTAQEDAR